jgi:hypothetical protein
MERTDDLQQTAQLSVFHSDHPIIELSYADH